jgi:hypothetical protein
MLTLCDFYYGSLLYGIFHSLCQKIALPHDGLSGLIFLWEKTLELFDKLKTGSKVFMIALIGIARLYCGYAKGDRLWPPSHLSIPKADF